MNEEEYELTLLGLLSSRIDLSDAKKLHDYIELYMRRNNFNAIVLDGTDFIFRRVEKR